MVKRLTALSKTGSPFTLPELNLPQSDAPTTGDSYPWLTYTFPALDHTWLVLKTWAWSFWCPLSCGNFRYGHDYQVT